MKLRWLVAVALIASVFSGCGRRRARMPDTPGTGSGIEEGIASWYGHPYHGRRAANGEIYDMRELTAAHRTLAFGTEVRVLNLANQRTVDVRITDRGPFVDGRIIDLSWAAAREIEMIGPGTAPVRLHVLSSSASNARGGWYAVQTGAFRDRGNADRQKAAMRKRFGTATLWSREGEQKLWRVLVGRTATLDEANALAEELRAELGHVFVVRIDGAESDLLN